MIDWNIQARAQACEACGEVFKDKQAYHTLLFDERAGYRRQDLCERCWSGQGAESTSRKGFVSHWQGIFEWPAPQPELIRKDTAETLLRKLVALNDPRHLAAVFILAVMLERKRLLKVKDQFHQSEGRFFIYEQAKTGDVFTIKDPGLNLDQLDGVQRDVAQLLEHGLEGAAGAAAADARVPGEPVDSPAPLATPIPEASPHG